VWRSSSRRDFYEQPAHQNNTIIITCNLQLFYLHFASIVRLYAEVTTKTKNESKSI
jgi:hypothetical protein